MATSILFTLLCALMNHGESNRWIFYFDYNDTFMDFFNSVYDSKFDNPYETQGVIYPPLTYLIYRFFLYLISPQVVEQGNMAMRGSQAGMLSLSLYILISGSLFVFSLYIYAKKWEERPVAVVLAVALSAPSLYTFERGNMILISLPFLLLYLAWYNSENPKLREASYLMLAISADLKFFPAVFGILLVQQRRWKDAVKCIIYGLLLFAFPFFFFGGLSNINTMMRNIDSTSEGFIAINTTRVDIGNVFRWLGARRIFPGIMNTLASVSLPIGALLLLAISFIFEDEWKKILTLSLICIALPGFSWMYNLIYFTPALICCIYRDDRIEHDRMKLTCFVLLGMMFLYYPFNYFATLPDDLVEMRYIFRVWDVISTLNNVILLMMMIICGAVEGISGSKKTIRFITDVTKGEEAERLTYREQIVFNII